MLVQFNDFFFFVFSREGHDFLNILRNRERWSLSQRLQDMSWSVVTIPGIPGSALWVRKCFRAPTIALSGAIGQEGQVSLSAL